MGDHSPVPASYKINNFGYLEINTQCTGIHLIQLKKIEGNYENVLETVNSLREELKNQDVKP